MISIPVIEQHPAAAVLKQYPAASMAKLLNISTPHLYNILKGTHSPSKVLESRITILSHEIEAGNVHEVAA